MGGELGNCDVSLLGASYLASIDKSRFESHKLNCPGWFDLVEPTRCRTKAYSMNRAQYHDHTIRIVWPVCISHTL